MTDPAAQVYNEHRRFGLVDNYDVPHPIWFRLAKLRNTTPTNQNHSRKLDREIEVVENDIERSFNEAIEAHEAGR